MSSNFTWPCFLCDAPTVDGLIGLFPGGEHHVHAACWRAWADGDTEALTRLAHASCEAGHHRFPGRWTRDPADPYGDAQFWECTKGCGHIQRHPGYGHGRQVAEMIQAQRPEQLTLGGAS